MSQFSKFFRILIRVCMLLGVLVFWAASPPFTSIHASNVVLKEFVQAQQGQMKTLTYRQKTEMKELKAAQEARRKEWEKSEKEARYKFFEAHALGPERRTYIQDFLRRREAFRKSLTEERTQRVRQHEAELNRMKQEQTSKLNDFKKSLDDGKTPDDDLWPAKK